MKPIIFDVCWTLYRSNTTFDFIIYVYMEKRIKNFRFLILTSKVGKIFFLLLGKLIGRDIYRSMFVGLLKGFTRSDLNDLVENFYYNFLEKKKIDYTFEIFNKIDTQEIVLCSASLDVVVSYIADYLNVDFFSSELEFKNDICTGKISKDLLGRKDILLEDENLELVVTDNLSDLPLVKKSSKSIILSTPKNVNFWKRKGFSVDYIL